MKTPTARLLLPEGVSAGAAIGAGGRNVRAIGTRHNVRCIVNPPQREIQFLGYQTNVASAMADFHAVFEQILATCAELEKPTPVNAAGECFIHVRAVAKTHQSWKFDQRDEAAVKVDAHTKHYDYQLVPSPKEEEALVLEGENVESTWLYEFNSAFRERMTNDVITLCHEKPERMVRLKAALGLTCFALRDASLASQTLSWTQVQALQQVYHIQPRWSSVWDASSPPVNALLARLLEVAAAQHAPIKSTMTVYVGTTNAKNVEDIVVKYRYENYKWVPTASLRPRRVLLAQYDIGTDAALGCRVRAYAREATSGQTPVNTSILDHLEVINPTVGSHFLTTVVARSTMPTNRFVRGCTVKDKLRIDWQGVRFVVSYMNKRRTRVRIECALVEADGRDYNQHNPERTLAKAMAALLDKVLHVTKRSDSR